MVATGGWPQGFPEVLVPSPKLRALIYIKLLAPRCCCLGRRMWCRAAGAPRRRQQGSRW